jgi:histidinol dehydrogenase
MKIFLKPEKESWTGLCKRPVIDKTNLDNSVRDIIQRVKSEKDNALFYFSEKFDGISHGKLKVPEESNQRINCLKI